MEPSEITLSRQWFWKILTFLLDDSSLIRETHAASFRLFLSVQSALIRFQYFHGLLFCILYLAFCPFCHFLSERVVIFRYFHSMRVFASIYSRSGIIVCIVFERCQYEYWVVLSGRQPDKCHMSTWRWKHSTLTFKLPIQNANGINGSICRCDHFGCLIDVCLTKHIHRFPIASRILYTPQMTNNLFAILPKINQITRVRLLERKNAQISILTISEWARSSAMKIQIFISKT